MLLFEATKLPKLIHRGSRCEICIFSILSRFKLKLSKLFFENFSTFPASSTGNRSMITSSILICKLIKSDSVTETFFSKNIVEPAKNDIGSRQGRRSFCKQIGARAFCSTLFSSITKMLRMYNKKSTVGHSTMQSGFQI